MFAKLVSFANTFGDQKGRPYFSQDGVTPMTAEEWSMMRAKFHCPVGFTNVWDRPPLKGSERIKVPGSNKAAHLNQKPSDLMKMLISASSDEGDVVWEPFGGLFSASLAAVQMNRKAYGAEIIPAYYNLALKRFDSVSQSETTALQPSETLEKRF